MNEEVFRKPPVRYPGEARQLSRPFERARGWEDSVYGEGVDDPEEQFNPLQLLLYVVRYRWLIASFVAFGVVTGIVITLAQTPRYRAEALLELVIPSAKAIQDLQVVSETADLRTFKTALEKLRSREMAQRVVHELGLTERADFLFPDTGFALQNLVKRAFAGQLDTPMGEMPARERERRAIARVHDGISMKLLHGTSIIAITYSSENPVYARRIANQFANTYIAQRLDQTTETSNLARRFISEQVAEVKRKLENSERALLNYAKAQGITVTGEEGSLVSANIKSINQALSKAIEERLRNERLVRQIEAGEAEKLEQVLNNEAIQQNRARIAELKAAYQQKRRRFKPEFPAMRQLAAQIQELEKLLHGDIGAIAKGIRLEYQSSIQKEKDLRRKLAELETQQAAYQDKNIKYTILKREVDSYRAQYKSLIDKLNELGVSSEIKNKSASIVQYADTPDSPFSPRLSVNLALALALSAFMAGGGAYLSELLNNTFSDPDQLESELNLPEQGILH